MLDERKEDCEGRVLACFVRSLTFSWIQNEKKKIVQKENQQEREENFQEWKSLNGWILEVAEGTRENLRQ